MSESSRLDDLRRRVQQDPSSIAFAQLAEEYRRAAMFQDAVDVCNAGLAIHPSYLSARVTLGRALIELERFDDALLELQHVLQNAPENLAAIRGLADIYHRRGDLSQALQQYRAALALARHDPDLEQTVADLAQQLEPEAAAGAGLSLEEAEKELLVHAPAPSPGARDTYAGPEAARAIAVLAALEQLLTAVHVVRAERRA